MSWAGLAFNLFIIFSNPCLGPMLISGSAFTSLKDVEDSSPGILKGKAVSETTNR